MFVCPYTANDGQAHFQDLKVPVGATKVIALQAGADMTYRWFPKLDFQQSARRSLGLVCHHPLGQNGDRDW